MGRRQGYGEGQPGEAGAGADVGDPAGVGDLGEIDRREAVGQVDAGGLLRRGDGRGRVGLRCQRLQQQREPADLFVVQVAADARERACFTGNAQEPAAGRSGATTSRRSGSSPSL